MNVYGFVMYLSWFLLYMLGLLGFFFALVPLISLRLCSSVSVIMFSVSLRVSMLVFLSFSYFLFYLVFSQILLCFCSFPSFQIVISFSLCQIFNAPHVYVYKASLCPLHVFHQCLCFGFWTYFGFTFELCVSGFTSPLRVLHLRPLSTPT